VSQAIGERVLLPEVRKAGPEDIVLADGFSCQEMITQNVCDKQPRHLAEVMRMAMRERAAK
ncbi:MAG: hypothetical protein JO295_04695, partial [Verrucomicrobia bacterium]|nr:hypothetical protein [Verrucomicrobiota bacterium]